MPDIASALKAEISRLARKQLRTDTESSRKAIASYRHQMADLKRKVQWLERQVSQLQRQVSEPSLSGEREGENDGRTLRFRPDGLAKHRQRLGLSAREMGLLLNASALSVYKWESGQARPRSRHLTAIAEVWKLGKREAAKRLEALAST